MTFQEAIDSLARDERFKATVSAMNTLLIQKGVYTQEEFEGYFCQWAEAQMRKASVTPSFRRANRPGASSHPAPA
jgi:hypothetical protein